MQRLSDLIQRLERDINPLNSVPTPSQRRDAVIDAAADLSADLPITRVATIAVVAGTASYALPADFLRLVRLSGLTRQGRVVIDGDGIIPLSGPTAPETERLTITDGALILYPTPAYTLNRPMDYQARHLLDAADTFPHMSDSQGRALLHRARAALLRLQAADQARRALSYQLGDERVSKEKLSAALRDQAADYDRQYQESIARLAAETNAGAAAPYGSRARVTG